MNARRLFVISIGVVLVLSFLAGCKAKQIATTANTPKRIKHLSVAKVTRLVKEHALDYKTLSVKKVNLTLNNDGKSLSVRGYYKIRKDSIIQISAQKLAIPIGKMEINADSFKIVSYLDQQNILGSLGYVSNLLGIDVDFNSIESLLTGQMFSFRQDSRENNFRDFACQIDQNMYKITSLRDRKMRKITKNEDRMERYRNRMEDNHLIKEDIYIDPDSFVVRKMVFDDMDYKRQLSFEFAHFEKVDNQWFPTDIVLDFKGEKSLRISLELSRISINDDWNFGFALSSKYKNKYLESVPLSSEK